MSKEVKTIVNGNLTLYLRTRNSLIDLLLAEKSGDWIVGKDKEKQISKIVIYNWDGTLMLEASHDISKSERLENNKLIVGLSSKDAKIVRCNPPQKWLWHTSMTYLDRVVEKQS